MSDVGLFSIGKASFLPSGDSFKAPSVRRSGLSGTDCFPEFRFPADCHVAAGGLRTMTTAETRFWLMVVKSQNAALSKSFSGLGRSLQFPPHRFFSDRFENSGRQLSLDPKLRG